MSFFKKLLGRNEKNPLIETPRDKVPNIDFKVEVDSGETKLLESSETHFEEKLKVYDVSEIKKRSTRLKSQEGTLAAIEFIRNFIDSTDIESKELISLLKKVIPYMIKENTIGDSEIVYYIEAQIERFSIKDDLVYQTEIADLFSRIHIKKAIEFLENKLGEIDTDKEKTIEHFDSIIQLSDFYLAEKRGDKAFQTVSRASQLVTNFNDKFDYISKQRIIAEKCAAICIKGQKTPQYIDYLHYEIVAFILGIANDLIGFPHLSGFFFRKSLCFNESWGFMDNEDFDKALDDLSLSMHKVDLLKDIFEFAFIELPIKMGIPKEYLKEDVLERLKSLSTDFDNNYPEWRKIIEHKEVLSKLPFDIALPHDFSGQVVKKYYKRENDNN